jgi:hypothetical protein
LAFSADSKVQVRKYLGYPLSSTALDATLDALDTSAANEVSAILDELADVESRLAGYARDVAGIARVNTLEFTPGMAIADLEHLGNGQAQKLANALGVEVRAFPFGSGTPRGPGALFFGA